MVEENRVQWVYSSRNNQELAERYDQWAGEYDEELERDFQWRGPQTCVDHVAKHVPKGATLLDAGAGTGLVGMLLQKLGYHDIVAIDLSQGMLDEAQKKNVYRELRQMALGEALDFPSGSFGAVVSVGVLTVGHAPASSLDELVRVTRPGGHVIFTLRPDVYESGGFKDVQQALESAGKWKQVEVSEPFQALPKGEPDVLHQVWVYQAV